MRNHRAAPKEMGIFKGILNYFLRIIATALVILLVMTLFPYARDWAVRLLPQGNLEQTSRLLSRKMEEVEEFTALRCEDTGIMAAETTAKWIGTVQQVNVPYRYEIGLGFSLKDVVLSPEEDRIMVFLPPIQMLYDSFQVTDEPAVQDFWFPLTEARYQEMLNRQAADCREAYLADQDTLESAWNAACTALESLFNQWSGQALPLHFEALPAETTETAAAVS